MNTFRITIGFSLFFFMHATAALAGEGEASKLSSICSVEDIETLLCEDNRDCAFKTSKIISKFLNENGIPKIKKTYTLSYPGKCFNRSYPRETVNLVFAIKPNGKVTNVQLLNSSNKCFNKKAKNHLKRIKFETSNQGYSCIPWTLSFPRKASSDSSGNKY